MRNLEGGEREDKKAKQSEVSVKQRIGEREERKKRKTITEMNGDLLRR